MKTTILSLILLLTVSCGKNETVIATNAFDDSQLKAQLVIQDARLKALEARMNAYETNFDLITIEFSNRISNLDNDFSSMEETMNENIATINLGLSDLQRKVIAPIKICNSDEHLIKTVDSVYAVYMVSNNYGTFLGKLSENVEYKTTDTVGARFKIVNNTVKCL